MSDDGTYKNEKKLLPTSNEREQLEEAVKAQVYKNSGGSISCGHDFWKKDVDYGEAVFCSRCNQFFVKIKVLPWIAINSDRHESAWHSTNHLESDFFAPLTPRITDGARPAIS